MKLKFTQYIFLGTCIFLIVTASFQILMLPCFSIDKLGQIGDMMGGMSAPFINLLSALLVYYAFQVQVNANEIQINNFEKQIKIQEDDRKLQQFESQLYKMLELHKENVNELEYYEMTGKVSAKGRAVFNKMITVLEYIYEISTQFDIRGGENWTVSVAHEDDSVDIQKERFTYAYRRFFFGYSFNNQFTKPIRFDIPKQLYPQNPLYPIDEGYDTQLAHYFRHLYLIVKFVVYPQNINLTYNEKMVYLKLLRAQLSNAEQKLLFYNWLVDEFGASWEDNTNSFFSNYLMIHNLRYDQLFKNKYIAEKLDELRKIDTLDRKTKLFDMDM